jgi:putative intracellular protease/amidase
MSAADTWVRSDGSEYATGFWAEELLTPYSAFVDAHQDVDFASPSGVAPTLDLHSVDPDVVGAEAADRLQEEAAAIAEILSEPLVLADIDAADYDAVFIPGGHAPMVDLFRDLDLGRILVEADTDGKVIAAVCHGPAGLLSAVDDDGSWLFRDRRMTAITDAEEREFGTAALAPWLLASRLSARGALVEGGPNWQPLVIQDQLLITGQNPASAGALAAVVLEELESQAGRS